MNRIYRIIWRIWLAGTILWAIAVWFFADQRPTMADIVLLITTREPPLSTFLTDPNAQCGHVSTEVFGQRLQESLDRRLEYPILELDGLSDAERLAARGAWQAEMDAFFLNQRLNLELQMEISFCGNEDDIEAARAHHEANRPRRIASIRISEFFWHFVTLPVTVLAIGLFLLWSPFRRRT